MFKHHTIRVAGAAVFAAALVGGVLTASVSAGHGEPGDPLGLIAPGGADCESAAVAYATAGWTVIDGDDFANVLIGGPGPDFIRAYAGNDDVDGLGGDDVLCLGKGDDRGQGGAGDDAVYGQLHDDLEWGEAGADYLDGGPNVDLCNGGPGVDTLFSC